MRSSLNCEGRFHFFVFSSLLAHTWWVRALHWHMLALGVHMCGLLLLLLLLVLVWVVLSCSVRLSRHGTRPTPRRLNGGRKYRRRRGKRTSMGLGRVSTEVRNQTAGPGNAHSYNKGSLHIRLRTHVSILTTLCTAHGVGGGAPPPPPPPPPAGGGGGGGPPPPPHTHTHLG